MGRRDGVVAGSSPNKERVVFLLHLCCQMAGQMLGRFGTVMEIRSVGDGRLGLWWRKESLAIAEWLTCPKGHERVGPKRRWQSNSVAG